MQCFIRSLERTLNLVGLYAGLKYAILRGLWRAFFLNLGQLICGFSLLYDSHFEHPLDMREGK